MQPNYVQRLQFVFSKQGPTRYIGHLDLARTLERSLNRAQIPLAYTQGYNPRPRLQLATALPLGFTSECEIADIWLLKLVAPEEALVAMQEKMAPGIHIHSISEVNLRSPALQTLVTEAAYTVTIGEQVAIDDLNRHIVGLLSAAELMRERRGKAYDLRSLVLDLDSTVADQGRIMLNMRLLQQPGKTGRPDEVLSALDLDPLGSHIHRTRLILTDAAISST
jgi:radical SAM-linked protein